MGDEDLDRPLRPIRLAGAATVAASDWRDDMAATSPQVRTSAWRRRLAAFVEGMANGRGPDESRIEQPPRASLAEAVAAAPTAMAIAPAARPAIPPDPADRVRSLFGPSRPIPGTRVDRRPGAGVLSLAAGRPVDSMT